MQLTSNVSSELQLDCLLGSISGRPDARPDDLNGMVALLLVARSRVAMPKACASIAALHIDLRRQDLATCVQREPMQSTYRGARMHALGVLAAIGCQW